MPSDSVRRARAISEIPFDISDYPDVSYSADDIVNYASAFMEEVGNIQFAVYFSAYPHFAY